MSAKVKSATSIRSDVGRYVIVPEWLLCSAISDKAIRLFCILGAKYADRATGEAFPSRATLARDLGVVRAQTVDAAVRELVDVGALEVKKRRGDDGINETNVYTLRFTKPIAAVEKAEGVAPEEGLPDSPDASSTVTPSEMPPSPAPSTTVAPQSVTGVAPVDVPDPGKNLTRSIEPEKDSRADALPFSLEETVTDQVTVLRARFERLCTVHPRVEKKKRAWKVFQKLNPSEALTDVILADIEKKKRTVWGGVEPNFITSLVNYLADERWTDEVSDIAPYSAAELARARQILGSRFLGRCPHGGRCQSDDECLKTIAAREREHGRRPARAS